MIKLSTPANGPAWLPAFAASIAAAFKAIMSAPFRLWSVATADLPPAADWAQGLVYDETLDTISYSDGTAWQVIPNTDGGYAWGAEQTFNAMVTVGATVADSGSKLLVRGTAKGVRLGTTASRSVIEGVDSTGAGSYQPLAVGGSELNLSLSGTDILTLESHYGSFANDGAASAGGVPVKGIYRNGSVLMVRVT